MEPIGFLAAQQKSAAVQINDHRQWLRKVRPGAENIYFCVFLRRIDKVGRKLHRLGRKGMRRIVPLHPLVQLLFFLRRLRPDHFFQHTCRLLDKRDG